MPSQCRSIAAANFSNGIMRCHFCRVHELSENFCLGMRRGLSHSANAAGAVENSSHQDTKMSSVFDSKDLPCDRPRVIVADPRSFMRACLACCLNKFGSDTQWFVSADAVGSVAGKGASHLAAVILSADSRPEGHAWLGEQTAGLRDAVPAVPIVLIMDEADLSAGREIALSLGCQGFIPMSSSAEIAVAALRLVIAGGRYFPHDIAIAPWRPMTKVVHSQPPRLGNSALTPREQEVSKLLSDGLPNKLIARKLGMALSTVKIHVHHILRKLNVNNRTEVAIKGRVVSLPITKRPAERQGPRQILIHEGV
jgi:DNA-binding NarL/FixJ family response regulator